MTPDDGSGRCRRSHRGVRNRVLEVESRGSRKNSTLHTPTSGLGVPVDGLEDRLAAGDSPGSSRRLDGVVTAAGGLRVSPDLSGWHWRRLITGGQGVVEDSSEVWPSCLSSPDHQLAGYGGPGTH